MTRIVCSRIYDDTDTMIMFFEQGEMDRPILVIPLKRLEHMLTQCGFNLKRVDADGSPQKELDANPMDYCLECGKYIGRRGFCSKKCHDAWYNAYVEAGW